MGFAAIAAVFVASQISQLQTAMAAKMTKMNADAASNGVKLLDAAAQNFNPRANVANGIGGLLDIKA